MSLPKLVVGRPTTIIIIFALAIGFGLGGRDVAARRLDEWSQNIKTKKAA